MNRNEAPAVNDVITNEGTRGQGPRSDDPLAQTIRPGAKSEYDATPYLP